MCTHDNMINYMHQMSMANHLGLIMQCVQAFKEIASFSNKIINFLKVKRIQYIMVNHTAFVVLFLRIFLSKT